MPIEKLEGTQRGAFLVGTETRAAPAKRSNKNYLEYKCTCVCGEECWVNTFALLYSTKDHCGGVAHGPFGLGKKVKQFTITSITFPDDKVRKIQKALFVVTCKCLRIRRFTYGGLYAVLGNSKVRSTRYTCGCNGLDSLYITGDPNLPAGVNTMQEFQKWAGVTHQNWYQHCERNGSRAALVWLTNQVEALHPGEGWRVRKIIPMTDKAITSIQLHEETL